MTTNTAWGIPMAVAIQQKPDPFGGAKFAGFPRRIGAAVIDVVAVYAITLAIFVAVAAVLGSEIAALVSTVGFAAYWPVQWVRWGRTLGMRAVRTSVVRNSDGRRLGYGRAMARTLGLLVNIYVWPITALSILLNKERKSPADALARTRVIVVPRAEKVATSA